MTLDCSASKGVFNSSIYHQNRHHQLHSKHCSTSITSRTPLVTLSGLYSPTLLSSSILSISRRFKADGVRPSLPRIGQRPRDSRNAQLSSFTLKQQSFLLANLALLPADILSNSLGVIIVEYRCYGSSTTTLHQLQDAGRRFKLVVNFVASNLSPAQQSHSRHNRRCSTSSSQPRNFW